MLARLRKEFADLKAQWSRVKTQTSAVKQAVVNVERAATAPAMPIKVKGQTTFTRKKNPPEEGTHGVRDIKASYLELMKLFGQPDHTPDGGGEIIEWGFVESTTGESVFVYAEPEAHSTNQKGSPHYHLAYWDDQKNRIVWSAFKKKVIGWSVLARNKDVAHRFIAWLGRQKRRKPPALKSRRVA